MGKLVPDVYQESKEWSSRLQILHCSTFSLRAVAAAWKQSRCKFLREQKNQKLLQENVSFEKLFDTSFDAEQQFYFNLGWFYFYFCFVKLFQL